MWVPSDKKGRLSSVGLRLTIYSVVATALFGIVDGILGGPIRMLHPETIGTFEMITVWCRDFRYLSEQLIFAGAIIFIGAKFIETRTIFTVGFDKLDAGLMSLNGPDENNIVWIGRRYRTKLEADVVADTIKRRLSEDAA